MKKSLILLIAVFFLSGCYKNWYKPSGFVFRHAPKNGSPGMRLGWEHGCESGLGSQFGGPFYMTFYTWKKDVDIASSNPNIELIRKRYRKELKDVKWDNPADVKKNLSDYKSVFWIGHAFCRHTVLETLQEADMEPPAPGDARYIVGGHHLGSIWRIDGKGDTRIGTGYW
jgi:hypothetical protein